ncbi:hypothetical protein N7474_009893 [Penicillium riverlandense]|uniref:uncharacterized protein n=1 Tax=Penicillium riverlandense TaxID=1903569 RepID=UPI002546E965|nr:uncharacterized protein N7474_009893 [Penicillium riverlandense]KAJ5808624.1 hypothetical protein N7474_009893 [Penicillium riverlandense]
MTNSQCITDWYNQNATLEHDRLNACRLEFSISMRKPLKILDLGGGTGRYAVELTRKGHSVTLVDISQSELDIAKCFAAESGVTLDAIVQADAKAIQLHTDKDDPKTVFAASSYDMILCQGPMYHLEESERSKVLCTCATLLRPGGFLLIAFVTQYAHLRDIAQRDPARLAAEYDGFYREYLLSGKYTRNPSGAMHHTHVSEIKELFRTVDGLCTAQHTLGIILNRIVPCEGFLGGGLSSKLVTLPQKDYELWVDVVMQFTDDEALLGNADHLLAVAERRQ